MKIAGSTKTVTYNGEEQSVEGYTVTSNPANADVTLVGKAVAAGTDADTYPMGLTAADFTATSPNYETVVIEVKDGWLKINPVSDKVTVTVTESPIPSSTTGRSLRHRLRDHGGGQRAL